MKFQIYPDTGGKYRWQLVAVAMRAGTRWVRR